MTIVDIAQKVDVSGMAPVSPNVFEIRPVNKTLAPFWITTFGAADETTNEIVFILGFERGFSLKYSNASSYSEMEAQEASFYWDDANQILYVHLEHDQSPFSSDYQYSVVLGLSDSDIVNIDGIVYPPLILSVPSFAQQEDLQDYDKLSFVNGTIRLNNTGSELDQFIANNTYGNDVFIYYLDDDLINEHNEASRSDFVSIKSLYIEDYDIELTEIGVRLQDRRKSQDITVPTQTFDTKDYPDMDKFSGNIIPLMYGVVRESIAIPTNDETESGDVYYRVALFLTSLGTVQVDIDKIWTTVTPNTISLDTGEFILDAADGRDSSGAVRDCRVLLPEGLPITFTSDIIKDLNSRFLGIEYISSNYNTSEWESEELSLTSGGWVFDEEILLFNAIKLVQNGSFVGFRYEINPEGLRTIRIDDEDRTRSGRVEPVDILNRDSMPVSTDSDLVFGNVQVDFNKSFNSGKFQNKKNSDYALEVKKNYDSSKKLTVKTMLNTEEEAELRALDLAEKVRIIPSIMSLELMGKEFLSIRIFDTYDVEATPGFADADQNIIIGREYYGIQKAKVISINPNLKLKTNTVSFKLIGDVDSILITDTGLKLITDTGRGIII